MPFGRTGKQNNRSHHSLDVGGAGPGPGAVGGNSAAAAAAVQGPSSASSTNPAAFSKESFDTSSPQQPQQQEHQQQSAIPSLHGVPIFANPASGGGGSNPNNNPNLVAAAGNPQQQQQQQQEAPPPPPPQQQQQQQHQQHPQHPQQQQQPQVASPAFDPRSPIQQQHQGKPLDFARSQSTRFPQGTPLQTPLHYAPASTSADDLSTTLHVAPPPALAPGQQPIGAPPPPQQVPEARRSTRKLIKNILSGGGGGGNRGSDSHHHHHHQQQQQLQQQQLQQQQQQQQQQQHYPPSSAYNNTGGLARRPSKRISQPPTIRTGVSQVSLDQQLEWPPQGQQITQPSPLQGDPHNTAHTIRRVPTDHESSPYGPDDIGSPHQGQAYIPLQGQGSPEHQQNPYAGQPQYEISPQQYHFQNQQQVQYQPGNPHVLAGHLNTNLQQNPETVSQLSHESPVTDTDQHSAHNPQSTQDSPAVNYPLQAQPQAFPGQPAVSPNQIQSQPQPQQQQQQQLPPPPQQQQQPQQPQQPPPQQSQQQQQPGMPPPPGPPPGRRSQEPEKMRGQADAPPGPPPGYRHSQASNMNPLPPPPQNQGSSGQPPNYRQNAAVQDRQFEAAQAEGRNSPQPSASDRDNAQESDKAMKELVVKYKNVKRLYFDGKNQIDQLTGQVEQLQNAIANQRMSQSRTSLDDNEYTTRFNRLNGAINNLSFNIRKDWVTLPSWIDKYVSAEALKTGKQEMTAVGRAVISRWVVEEIFNYCFHPGLEPDLSRQLKDVEQNIRRFSYKMNSQEEFDALTSKVVSWRMATLDGLQAMLSSPESGQHRIDFTQRAATNLTASLYQHLADPPPPGVDGSASMIVELAIEIAFHLPMESRDVAIIYPLPLDNVVPHLMEVEKAPLPPLESRPGDDSDSEDEEGSGGNDEGKGGNDRKSRSGPPPKDPGKVRFAGFMAVDVRGRQVLVKAPVWTLG